MGGEKHLPSRHIYNPLDGGGHYLRTIPQPDPMSTVPMMAAMIR